MVRAPRHEPAPLRWHRSFGAWTSYDHPVSDDDVADFHRQLGRLLATWREERGLSQEALAVQLRCDQSFISRVEAGSRHASMTFLLEWADAMNVPFDDVARRIAELWSSRVRR